MTNMGEARRRTSPAAWLLIAPVRFYQKFITPYTPASCRYYPTCSEYAVRSLRTHGAIKGAMLTVWRLLRCNPWSSGGVDHTPERGRWRCLVSDAPGSAANEVGGSAGRDVIRGVFRTHTCGNAICDADETARPAACAPNAGRAAA